MLSTMLRKMPARMAARMPEVVRALVAKLGASDSSPLVTSLLCVLAQLVHADVQQLLGFLASQPAPAGALLRLPQHVPAGRHDATAPA